MVSPLSTEAYTPTFTALCWAAVRRMPESLGRSPCGSVIITQRGRELQACLGAARKAHDREAEHEVRRERDARRAECQAKIDAGTARMGLLEFHVKAIEILATALGLSFE